MLSKKTAIAASALLAIGLLGCSTPSQLEENWGRSFKTAKTAQILNPDGPDNTAPVEGLQGPVVEKILERHLVGQSGKENKSSGFGVLTIKP